MDYQLIDTTLSQIDPDLTAAEIHGLACGLLCMNNHVKPSVWLEEITAGQGTLDPEAEALLYDVFNQCATQLTSHSLQFELLLPEEDSTLTRRLEGLRRWCQGYLYGVGTASQESEWPEDMREVIKDLTELTKLESDANEGNEAENDFMEIAEYVKTGVIYINEEMNPYSGGTVH